MTRTFAGRRRLIAILALAAALLAAVPAYADATFRVEDATLEDGTGASVGAGDVNGDGLQDLLFGQPGMEGGAPRSGGLSIVFGGTAY